MTNRGRIMFMSTWKSALLAAMLAVSPASAHAETAPTTPMELPADRLAAATRLIDLMMPAAQRDAMADQLVSAIMTTLTSSLKGQDYMATALQNPKVEEVLDRFIDRQRQWATDQLRTEMPEMLVAMSRAYARRFDASQLNEMTAFFGTPTGQAYIRESFGIMSDPDVTAWQRNSMSKSLERLPVEMRSFQQELEKVLGKPIGKLKS